MKAKLTQTGKEELALALILWKDFKAQGKLDIEITRQALQFADNLGISQEYDKLNIRVPPMKIQPR